MSWMDGISQCWPLAKDCVVWWDAWAVIVAVGALLVAWLGVMITGLSALAVYWLGKQANRVAKASHDVAEADRSREERFLLTYLFAEVLSAWAAADGWVRALEQDGAAAFVRSSEDKKKDTMAAIKLVDLPEARKLLSRLHVIDGPAGTALTEALSSIELIKLASQIFVDLPANESGEKRIKKIFSHVASVRDKLDAFLVAVRPLRSDWHD